MSAAVTVHREYYPAVVEGLYEVKAGEIFNSHYKATHILGRGYSSTVWLAEDLRTNPPTKVALKLLLTSWSNAKTRDLARDELEIMKTLRDTDPSHHGHPHVCQLLDTFSLESPGGTNICIVLESLGVSVLDLHDGFDMDSELIPLSVLKRAAQHTLRALEYIHACGIVHTDLKGDNILAVGDSNDPTDINDTSDFKMEELLRMHFKVIDFSHSNRLSNRIVSGAPQPFSLRAPEVMLGADWGIKIDIWSLGCTLHQYSSGRGLINFCIFTPTERLNLLQLVAIFGEIPSTLLSRGSRTEEFFDDQGQLLEGDDEEKKTMDLWLSNRIEHKQEDQLFADFLSKMLIVEPNERWDATQLLGHRWLADLE